MSKRNIVFSLSSLLGLLIFTAIFLNRDIFANYLGKYNLLPKPEPLTELYFEDHLKLPENISPDREYQVGFVVHNLEYEDYKYDYSVISDASGSATLLNKGSFSLKHDEYKTIREKFSISEDSLKTKISVNLDNKKQSIHFWVTNTEFN